MKILVLGGTRFIGRHVAGALSAAHEVACYRPGTTRYDVPSGLVEWFAGRTTYVSSIGAEAWDVIVDAGPRDPRAVRQAVQLRATRYVLLSGINVYADLAGAGIEETASAGDACEDLVLRAFGQRAVILRCGLVVGASDPADRLGYWCERTQRGGRFLAPGPPERPVQLIDAVDVARFVLQVVADGPAGIFNVVGPRSTLTFEMLLAECARGASALGGTQAVPVWAGDDFLLQHGIQPWAGMPFWVPGARLAGYFRISNARAVAAGLSFRPLSETVLETFRSIACAPNAEPRLHAVAQRRRDLPRPINGGRIS